MSSSESRVTGIVLAGGSSTRMGCDKASLPWGKADLLHAVLMALDPVCEKLIVVSNIPRVISVPGVKVVSDTFHGCGPLGGIHAGLSAAATDNSFIVACDMPFINSCAVEYLASVALGFGAVVPFVDGFFHPLHAIYSRSCLSPIERMLNDGQHRIIDFYPKIRLRKVSCEELSQFDPELKMLCNLNRPQDLPYKL